MKKNDFDILREWIKLSKKDLIQIYSLESCRILKNIVDMLGDEKDRNTTITRENFVSTIKRMREIYEKNSLELSRTILESGDHKDSGQEDKAVETLERFIGICRSPFYSDIARGYRERLLRGKSK